MSFHFDVVRGMRQGKAQVNRDAKTTLTSPLRDQPF